MNAIRELSDKIILEVNTRGNASYDAVREIFKGTHSLLTVDAAISRSIQFGYLAFRDGVLRVTDTHQRKLKQTQAEPRVFSKAPKPPKEDSGKTEPEVVQNTEAKCRYGNALRTGLEGRVIYFIWKFCKDYGIHSYLYIADIADYLEVSQSSVSNVINLLEKQRNHLITVTKAGLQGKKKKISFSTVYDYPFSYHSVNDSLLLNQPINEWMASRSGPTPSERIQALESENAALKAEISNLKSKIQELTA